MNKKINVNNLKREIKIGLTIRLLLSFCCVLLSVVSYAQNAKVSLNRKNAPVKELLNDIEKQTDYLFVYSSELVNFSASISAKNETVNSVLNRLFSDRSIRFELQGKHIVLSKVTAKSTEAKASDVVAKHTVKGRVMDTKGAPIIGATVLIKETMVGTTTDIDGSFTLSVSSENELEVSYVGYTSQNVLAGDKTSFDIYLVEDTNVLDEVVVVGYGTLKKRNLVGAVDQIDSKMIADRSNGNLARSLQGEVPGLNITFTDSKPSRSASFNVRGTTSIGAGGSTLVLIDGVEGDLNSINPQDVESVSVLKDASSTAVYGARGAFGVILVTTKSAKKGTPTINYNGSVSINRRTVIPDVITDGLTWINWWRDSYNGYYNGSRSLLSHVDSTIPYSEAIYQELIRRKSDSSLSRTTTLEGDSMFGWAYMESTDWLKLFYKDFNMSNEHNISISGGSDQADYYVSGRYYDMDGIYRVGNESYKKYDLRAKGSLKIRPWFKILNNTSFSVVTQHEPKHSRNNFNVQKAINHAAMPLSPVKNPDGSWTTAAAISGYAAFSEGTSYRNNDYSYFRNKLSADIDIVKDVLKAQADYSYNYTTRKRVDVQNPITYSKKPGVYLLESESAGSLLSQVDYTTRYQAANAYLTYTPKLGDNHGLTVLAGWNIEDQRYETLSVSRSGFVTITKPSFSLMNGVSSDPVSGGNAWSYVGAFYRINYDYKGKYLVEVSGRYDGSSKFPVYSKWGFFPSASIAWRVSDESWMNWAHRALDNAKIRLSVGSMGNGNVSPYSYTSEMSVSTASDIVLGGSYPTYTTVGGTVPTSLTWEKSTTYDVGLDLDFFQNRLSFSGDVYRRYTTDMYTASVALPSVYGTTPPKGNNAELKTDGWEVSLAWRDSFKLGGKPFSYSIKAMMWDSKSVVTKYINDSESLGTVANYIKNGGTPSSYYNGMTIGEIWGYTVVGLFRDQDDIDSSAIHNFTQSSDKITRPGQVKFADLDGNGFIDPGTFSVHDHGDLRIIGNQSPRYRYGLNLSANWNGIGLSVFLQGVGKRDWYPGSDAGYFWGKYGRPFFAVIPSIHNYTSDMYSEALNNWDTAYWPRITTYQSNGTNNWTKPLEIPNTRYLQDASYLRVKTIQIDYTFNERVCRLLHLKGLKLYANGENLFTFTPLHKYAPNFDPEGLSYDSDFASAADGYTYPILKSITVGVNITF
jgi:TonB-linked SusC/RagA family outer membrane protein